MPNSLPKTGKKQASSRDQKHAARVLEILDRWSARFEGHQTEKRKHSRKQFRGPVTISVHADALETDQGGFHATARNLSAQGLSFIHATSLSTKELVICLDPSGDGGLCMQAEIVRCREVHDGFFEYGVAFRGRVSR